MAQSRLPLGRIAALGLGQIVNWGSLYYAITILAPAMTAEAGLSSGVVYGGFSLSLLVSGLAAPAVGRALDRFGGRRVMALGSVVAAAALLALGSAQSASGFLVASVIAGVAMSLALYDAAFAALVQLIPRRGGEAIAALTLFGGFASTLFWPLTQALEGRFGWRATDWIYAFFQLAVCLPLHVFALKSVPEGESAPLRIAPAMGVEDEPLPRAMRRPALLLVMSVFAANNFVFSALSVHFVPLLTAFGLTAAVAVAFGTLVGPAQVAGRVATIAAGDRLGAIGTGLWSTALLPVALASLVGLGGLVGACGFAVLYGLSNGVITIARGTLPLALFGRGGFGALLGAIAMPSLLARAAAPLAFAAVAERGGMTGGLALAAAASLASLAAMIALARLARRKRRPEPAPDPRR